MVVGLPDVRGREQILKVHMRRVPLATDIDAADHCARYAGPGADLANLVNEAALFTHAATNALCRWLSSRKRKTKSAMGAERRSMVMTECRKKPTAYRRRSGLRIVGRPGAGTRSGAIK